MIVRHGHCTENKNSTIVPDKSKCDGLCDRLRRNNATPTNAEYITKMRRAPNTSPTPPLINFPNEVPNTAYEAILDAKEASVSTPEKLATSLAMTGTSVIGTETAATDREYAIKSTTFRLFFGEHTTFPTEVIGESMHSVYVTSSFGSWDRRRLDVVEFKLRKLLDISLPKLEK